MVGEEKKQCQNCFLRKTKRRRIRIRVSQYYGSHNMNPTNVEFCNHVIDLFFSLVGLERHKDFNISSF